MHSTAANRKPCRQKRCTVCLCLLSVLLPDPICNLTTLNFSCLMLSIREMVANAMRDVCFFQYPNRVV